MIKSIFIYGLIFFSFLSLRTYAEESTQVDEIVQKYLYELSDEEQEILFDFLEEFENKTQVDLNRKLINKTKSRFSAENPLKIEVFKDETSSSKLIN